MFNHPSDTSRAPDYSSNNNNNSSYGFANNQSWSRFGFNPSPSSAADPSQLGHDSRQSFGDASGMDWTQTPSDMQSHFHHEEQGESSHQMDNLELEDLTASHSGGGVGRLVAQFEAKGFTPVPPLPPRPIHNQQQASPNSTSPSASSHFGSLNAAFGNSNRMASPITSPSDTNFGSLQSRVTSPTAHSPGPLISFGSFPDVSRMPSPGMSLSSLPFGNMDDFMTDHRVSSPMAATPMASTPMVTSPGHGMPQVRGTPGFDIWRPPGSGNTRQDQSHAMNPPPTSSGNYFRPPPPVPTTPKPVMNAGNQFILELNPGSKGKGKAPAKPPRPRALPPVSTPTPVMTNQFVKEEPQTPQLSDLSPFSSTLQDDQQGSVSLRTQAGTRPSREQVPAEAWEQFKTTIRTLYLEERRPLKEVMGIMSDKFGFQATPKMYKTRFSQWGFVKNNTEDEVKRLLSMKFQRDAEGKVSEFVRNGRVVNLGTYLKRKGVTEYDLVDFELPADLPAHIRCRTPTPPPTPGYLSSPDLVRAQELVIGNMRKAFLQCRQFEVENQTNVKWPSTMVWGAGSSELLLEANFYFEAMDADQGGNFLMKAFKQLEMDLKKLSPQGIQELLLGMVHRNPGMTTALCKYLAAYSMTNFERSHPLRLIFTCLYEVQQKHGAGTLSELLWGSIPTIAEELEAIYGPRHPYVARTWVDLALFYNHVNPDRLEKLVLELRVLQQQMEQRLGPRSPDVLTLRYAMVQLLYVANPQGESTKQAVAELWNQMRNMQLVSHVRDPRGNVYCYHSPVKVDPWTKRCRRRYDSGVAIIEEHLGVRIMPYFEEDFHTTTHVPDPQQAWAMAMEQQSQPSKWAFI